MKPTIRIFSDPKSLYESAAESLVATVIHATQEKKQFSIALAGGNTPRGLYSLLGEKYPDRFPWIRIHLFWGDERYVRHSDSQSNYRTVQETLLDKISIPAENVHPMPTDYPNPDNAARSYEMTLRNHFHSSPPRFNLIILGIGSDGHTASLFPQSRLLDERIRWVAPSHAPNEPRQRLTLTIHVLANAERIFFLVTGADKAEALRMALATETDAGNSPAARVVHSSNGSVVFWVDQKASELLPRH